MFVIYQLGKAFFQNDRSQFTTSRGIDEDKSIYESAMREAIELANNNVLQRGLEGGPFGCVIIKKGKIVGRGKNQVRANKDPTAHAEVQAIRDACANLQTNTLEGCEMVTTSHPCPLCFGAVYWAGIQKVIYGISTHDLQDYGYQDDLFYKEMMKDDPSKFKPHLQLMRNEALTAFEKWDDTSNPQYST